MRTDERGLSSAVLRGFREARGSLLLCMDADLQHPPEKVFSLMVNEPSFLIDSSYLPLDKVPDMFKVLGHEEFVIGTRYGSGELKVDKDWPLYRQVNGSSISSSCVRSDINVCNVDYI